jgi:hypothetical protein
MAQLNVRLPDALYQEVQSILKEKLKIELSEFVREIFVDMILIYADRGRQAKTLARAGERHRIDTRPGMIMMLSRDWTAERQRRADAALDRADEAARARGEQSPGVIPGDVDNE